MLFFRKNAMQISMSVITFTSMMKQLRLIHTVRFYIWLIVIVIAICFCL